MSGDYLVKLAGKVSEDLDHGPVGWVLDDHYGDRIGVKLGLVVANPGDDEISVATLHITVMADGTFLVSRTAIGSWSLFVASGNLLSTDGMGQQADAHVRMHSAPLGEDARAALAAAATPSDDGEGA
jgi:hypothetical protein